MPRDERSRLERLADVRSRLRRPGRDASPLGTDGLFDRGRPDGLIHPRRTGGGWPWERADWAGLAAFLVVYAYLLRGIVIGKVYAFGDLSPYYGAGAFAKFANTWHPDQLGYGYLYSALPAYFGVVTELGGAVAQNLFYLSLIPLGFATFLVLVRRFVDHRPARWLAAGLYALNPVTIAEFVNGGVAALIGFVGLPLVVHYLFAIEERDTWRSALKLAAVFGATTISAWLEFWMILPFAAYVAVRTYERPQTVGKYAAAGAWGIVLALPNFHHVLQRADRFDEGRAFLLNALRWNYAEADLLSVLRLAGNHGSLAMNELGYNAEPTMVVGLVVPFVALFSLRRRELAVFQVTAGIIAAFLVATHAGVTEPLFTTFDPLLSLRNPEKLQYPLLLSLAVLFGGGAEAILGGARAPSRSATDTAVVGLLVLALFTYALPAAGALGLEETRGDDYYVSDDTAAVAAQLEGRVLWVPYGYTTQLHLRHAYPNHVGVKSGGFLQGIQNTDFVAGLFDDLANGRSVTEQLRSLGVRYVVVARDPPADYGAGEPRMVWRFGSPWLWGSPDRFEAILAESPDYTPVHQGRGYTVYRVADVPERGAIARYSGLHAVSFPEEPTVRRVGPNRVRNPDFASGLDGWWTPPETASREVTATGDAVVVRTDPGADRLPISQQLETRPGHPYEVEVEATGDAVLNLFWYEGEKSKETLVVHEQYALEEAPVQVVAAGDVLSLRITPAANRLAVRRVGLYRTTYPPATTVAENVQGIPGAVTTAPVSGATTVASNRPDADAAVEITDAETVLAGELVFAERYRQGVAVRVPPDEPLPVPEDAEVVTDEDGAVVDYWVTGEFDDTDVTVVRTSYDEGWRGPPGATHFRAFGWANGFTDAAPSEIRPPDDRYRAEVIAVWLVAWLLTAVGFAVPFVIPARVGERVAGSIARLRETARRLVTPR